ncbi:MAG: polysaccharide pyruvyl transferase family protein [Verrucomicrobiota bacterium]|nr:polysaccharide pyruvyl transferase family protein [Verrucomicrobiota bacterium]
MASPIILLRNAWQTENIGDIAHTPGALQLLLEHMPEAHIILWAGKLDRGVDVLLKRSFPNLVEIVTGKAVKENTALLNAFARADFLLHGSGSGLVAFEDVLDWQRIAGKPFGTIGISVLGMWDEFKACLNQAAFILCRETKSVALVQDAGITTPVAFTPDTAFACGLRNDPAANDYLQKTGLAGRPFLCAIPRLRYTPYHTMVKVNWTAEHIAHIEAVNRDTMEPDHAQLREAIIHWVRETGHPVLICPEMTYQTEIMRPLVYDPLPVDVRAHCVLRDTYWLTDEAASVYRQATAIASMEMHSPILAIHQGTPACHLHQPTDTHKSQMWNDLGMANWHFDIDAPDTGLALGKALVEIARNPTAAKAQVAATNQLARTLHQSAMERLRACLMEAR